MAKKKKNNAKKATAVAAKKTQEPSKTTAAPAAKKDGKKKPTKKKKAAKATTTIVTRSSPVKSVRSQPKNDSKEVEESKVQRKSPSKAVKKRKLSNDAKTKSPALRRSPRRPPKEATEPKEVPPLDLSADVETSCKDELEAVPKEPINVVLEEAKEEKAIILSKKSRTDDVLESKEDDKSAPHNTAVSKPPLPPKNPLALQLPENSWGPAFGTSPCNTRDSPAAANTSPLSSWYLSQGHADFIKRPQFPVEEEMKTDSSNNNSTTMTDGGNSLAEANWRMWYGHADPLPPTTSTSSVLVQSCHEGSEEAKSPLEKLISKIRFEKKKTKKQNQELYVALTRR